MLVVLMLVLNCSRLAKVAACSGNFSLSCHYVELIGTHTLQASCGAPNTFTQFSTLDLDEHIFNIGGGLRCRSIGNFSASCRDETVTDTYQNFRYYLNAQCNTDYNIYIPASLNLDDCVTNNNGKLGWACV
ncbi:hypothetical protein GOP47_0023698 [Adiantum capillus-veneris]|uniref:Cyanovirin-N domain-containing protein n=1 Tax=Adiantum capillus-veneris TaxID=13818 RepID=A0A9D4Z3L7_ADICA|nr:hypothetical protein GOP47_0023698 [Adiantum capillus-veneris]